MENPAKIILVSMLGVLVLFMSVKGKEVGRCQSSVLTLHASLGCKV